METQSDISHLLIDGKENTVEGEEVRSFIGTGGSVLAGHPGLMMGGAMARFDEGLMKNDPWRWVVMVF